MKRWILAVVLLAGSGALAQQNAGRQIPSRAARQRAATRTPIVEAPRQDVRDVYQPATRQPPAGDPIPVRKSFAPELERSADSTQVP